MERVREEAEKIVKSGALGRSSQLADLFGFLVANADQAEAPKEAEIADRVFGRSTGFDPAQDALVRVHVHRLRTKIDQYYLTQPNPDGVRLRILKGEYRLVIDDGSSPDQAQGPSASPTEPWKRRAMIARVLCLALGSIVAWQALNPRGRGADLPIWSNLRDDARTELIVVGDRFVFAERDPASGRTRLLRDQTIRSGEELDNERMLDPRLASRTFNPQITDLPVGVAAALRYIMPAITVSDPDRQRVRLLPMSEVTPDMLRVANIVYVGHLSDIAFLGDPLFSASRVEIQAGGLKLVERKTGRLLAQAPTTPHPGPRSEDDFGYIASFAGPNGNRVVVVAGGGNVGLMQAAEIAVSPKRLEALARDAGGPGKDFEAVLQVSSLHNLNVGSRVVLAAPLDAAAIWRNR